jgi:hypothetical protein
MSASCGPSRPAVPIRERIAESEMLPRASRCLIQFATYASAAARGFEGRRRWSSGSRLAQTIPAAASIGHLPCAWMRRGSTHDRWAPSSPRPDTHRHLDRRHIARDRMGSRNADLSRLLLHAAWLRRLAFHLVRDEAEAEDVVQEAWAPTAMRPPEGRVRRDRGSRKWCATLPAYAGGRTVVVANARPPRHRGTWPRRPPRRISSSACGSSALSQS